MKSVLAGLAFALVPIATASPAAASEYSCTHVAAANGYVNESKYLWQVQQDCATAYEIAYPGPCACPRLSLVLALCPI